ARPLRRLRVRCRPVRRSSYWRGTNVAAHWANMTAAWDRQALLQPIAADSPCGENLEDTPLLASFDTFRVFGRRRSPEDPEGQKPDPQAGLEKPDPERQ